MIEFEGFSLDLVGFELKEVNLRMGRGEYWAILGPSGAGKTVLLECIAGLHTPARGRIRVRDRDVTHLPPEKRRIALVYQDYSLFPHMTVERNIAFGLRMQNLPAEEIRQRVQGLIDQCGLAAFRERYPASLSGGEQQRAALARALAPRPRLLLLDEPPGALDKTLREQLVEELRHLLHVSGTPAVYVTHDQEEAFAVADRLVLLNQGRVGQRGTPAEIYNSPDTPWVARFLGLTNLVPGEVVSSQPLQVRTDLGLFQPACPPGAEPAPGSKVTLLFKPSGASVAPAPQPVNGLEGVVEDVVFRGEAFRVTLALDHDYRFSFNLEQRPTQGQPVSLALEDGAVLCLG